MERPLCATSIAGGAPAWWRRAGRELAPPVADCPASPQRTPSICRAGDATRPTRRRRRHCRAHCLHRGCVYARRRMTPVNCRVIVSLDGAPLVTTRRTALQHLGCRPRAFSGADHPAEAVARAADRTFTRRALDSIPRAGLATGRVRRRRSCGSRQRSRGLAAKFPLGWSRTAGAPLSCSADGSASSCAKRRPLLYILITWHRQEWRGGPELGGRRCLTCGADRFKAFPPKAAFYTAGRCSRRVWKVGPGMPLRCQGAVEPRRPRNTVH